MFQKSSVFKHSHKKLSAASTLTSLATRFPSLALLHPFFPRHMMSTLQALRGGREVLLSTMDVFLNEPVIDWLKVKTEGGSQAVRKGENGIVGYFPQAFF